MKRGLILEGGAMRGMFTAGALDVMMTHEIQFDGIIGVSAGAAFGCNYKSNQPGRALRYNKKYCKDPRYCSVQSWIKTGDFYGGEFCYNELPCHLDPFDSKAFAASPIAFYVVCTDSDTGKPVYHQCSNGSHEDMQWIRASASMPILSRDVVINGQKLLDGGCSDSVPLEYFESIGYDRNIVILTQPRSYVKKNSSLLPAMKLMLKKHPYLAEDLATRAERYNEEIKNIYEQEQAGQVMVLTPSADLGIGKAEKDPDELQRVYELGRQAALSRLEEMKQFLEGR